MVSISDKQVDSWLKKFVKKVKCKYDPSLLVLFGSRARGDHLEESDLDILIVSDLFKEMKWPDRLGKVSEIWEGYVEIEPLCYTKEEFEKKKLGL